LESFERTIKEPSQVEVLLKIDNDDVDTLNYIKNAKFSYDIVSIIGERDPGGYKHIGIWHNEMSQRARGKLIMWYGDDCVPSPPEWDILPVQYADMFGVINTNENEGAPFNVVFFYTAKLYRTMQWLGTHPYNDRWFHILLQQFPQLVLGSVDMHTEHIKDNPPSQDAGSLPIYPSLSDKELSQWRIISERVDHHLKLIGQ
jgi:hypothetical protein